MNVKIISCRNYIVFVKNIVSIESYGTNSSIINNKIVIPNISPWKIIEDIKENESKFSDENYTIFYN